MSDSKIKIVKYFVNLLTHWNQVREYCAFGLFVFIISNQKLTYWAPLTCGEPEGGAGGQNPL